MSEGIQPKVIHIDRLPHVSHLGDQVVRGAVEKVTTEANLLSLLARIERGEFPVLQKVFPTMFAVLERVKHERAVKTQSDIELAHSLDAIMQKVREHLSHIAHNSYEAAEYLGEKFNLEADMDKVLRAYMAEDINIGEPKTALPILQEGIRLGFINHDIAAQILALNSEHQSIFLEIVLGLSSLNAYLSDFQSKIMKAAS